MADDVTFTVNADATPPGGTVAATDETTAGPHSVGSHMGIAKLAVSADGDSTHIPATTADGLLVEVSNSSGSLRGANATRSTETGAADAQILAANASRIAARFFNNADQIFFLGEGGSAVTSSDFTMMLRPGEWYGADDFTGEYRGLFNAAVGSGELQVTEID